MKEPATSLTHPHMLAINLGSVLLFTDGRGYYTRRKGGVPCEIIVELDPDIEINEDCEKVDFASSLFTVLFTNGDYSKEWNDHPYTDKRFADGVRDFLTANGLPPSVDWSERGRQYSNGADFDCGYDVLEALFPKVFANARNRMIRKRPKQIVDGRIEYSITRKQFVIRVLDAMGNIVKEEIGDNQKPPFTYFPLHGSHSMTSMAKEQIGRLAAWYQISNTRKVKA